MLRPLLEGLKGARERLLGAHSKRSDRLIVWAYTLRAFGPRPPADACLPKNGRKFRVRP